MKYETYIEKYSGEEKQLKLNETKKQAEVSFGWTECGWVQAVLKADSSEQKTFTHNFCFAQTVKMLWGLNKSFLNLFFIFLCKNNLHRLCGREVYSNKLLKQLQATWTWECPRAME